MRKLVFLGNCQARRLQVFYDEHFAPITGDKTEVLASFGQLTPEVRAVMAAADVIITQAIDSEHEVTIDKVENDARIILYPNVTGVFLWPFSGCTHIRNQPLPHIQDGPYGIQFGNRWMNTRIKAGARPEDIATEYEALDLSKAVNLDRLYELALTAARRRDERTGFGIAAIIEKSLTEMPLFMTPGNLDAPLFKPLAAGVYTQLGIPTAAIEAALGTLWRSPFPIADYPIHPSVARHYGLKFIGPDTRYRTFSGERLTFSEWVGRYARYEWNDMLLDGIDRSSHVRHFDAEAQAILDQIDAGLAASNGSAIAETRRAHLLRLKGDHAAAIEATRRAMAFEPDDPQIPGTLAIYLAETGEFAEAERIAREMTARWPRYADGWNRFASVLARQGKLAEAEAAVRHAVEIEPRNVEFNRHLAALLLQQGQAEPARHLLTGLIAMMPDRAELYGELSRVLEQAGSLDAALIAIRRGVMLDAGNVSLRRQLANLLVRRNDAIGASNVLREAMALAPDRPDLRISLANLLIRLGRIQDARAEFDQAIALDPANVHFRNQFADALHAAGDLAAAEQAYRDVIALDPSHTAARGTLALVLDRLGRIDESLAVVDEALALAPDDPHLLAKQSHLLTQTGDFAKARAAADRAVALAPQIAGLHAGLGDVLERQGNSTAALAAYQAAAQRDADNQHFRRQIERLSVQLHSAQRQADAAE